MRLSDLLGLQRGDRVAVVGCGGKTALIDRLADENREWSVLIAPTTRIALDQRRERPGVAYLGVPEGEKLVAAPLEAIGAASLSAGLTLMEADGSKRKLLKGWAAHEPVVPDFATLTVGVISRRALGLAVDEQSVHRLELFLEQTGLRRGDIAGEADVLRMIRWCMQRHARGRQAIVWREEDGEWSAI